MSEDSKSQSFTPVDRKWKILHREACAKGLETYIDPDSGYQVFTALHHKKRGSCCESGCRHCPYGFLKDGTKDKN